jgi:hypothetical protein
VGQARPKTKHSRRRIGLPPRVGFEVLPTGTDANHFDVQRISGVAEADAPPSEQDVQGCR